MTARRKPRCVVCGQPRGHRAHKGGHVFAPPSDEWNTPDWLLELVRQIAPIGLDPCSNPTSTVGARVSFTREEDGLTKPWADILGPGELAFVNPPYSQGNLRRWVEKCANEAAAGAEVMALLPANTSTSWCQTHVFWGARATCFLNRRVQFVGPVTGSPRIDSLIVHWGAFWGFFAEAFENHGAIAVDMLWTKARKSRGAA
jgi:phage N-6-adenine-methyltransferase